MSCRRPNEQHKTERLEEARAGGALSQSEGEQYVFERRDVRSREERERRFVTAAEGREEEEEGGGFLSPNGTM